MRSIVCARLTLLPLTVLFLTGCMVGPDFKTPEAPAVRSYTGGELPRETESAPGPAGASQQFLPGRDIPSAWWRLFGSPELDSLVAKALDRSPTVKAAEYALVQARENLAARRGTVLFPSADVKLSAERQKISGAAFGEAGRSFSPFTLYNATVAVTYALDIFGGGRRELESLRSQVDDQRYLYEASRVTLAANVVTAAVQEASLRSQLRAFREVVSLEEQQLEITQQQFNVGAVAGTDVISLRAQLAQTRAGLPGLERSVEQVRYQLAVLTGGFPVESATIPVFELEKIELPSDLPVSLPSSLVRQRPDVLASEALLHAASAQIGVATANLFPQITLNASFGSEPIEPGNLFSRGSVVWDLTAGLTQPLFHGGELTAKRRAAVAAFEQADAQYRSTVLQAFLDVANVLNALDADARTLKAQATAESAARDLMDVTRKQLTVGAVSHLDLLNAERQYLQALINLIQARAARLTDTAALFQALGGGWWNEEANLKSPGTNSEQETNSKSQKTNPQYAPNTKSR